MPGFCRSGQPLGDTESRWSRRQDVVGFVAVDAVTEQPQGTILQMQDGAGKMAAFQDGRHGTEITAHDMTPFRDAREQSSKNIQT